MISPVSISAAPRRADNHSVQPDQALNEQIEKCLHHMAMGAFQAQGKACQKWADAMRDQEESGDDASTP